ncbi:unnamed protein product, partial [marine sediment metagenome]
LGVEVEEYDPLPLEGKNVIKMAAELDGFKKEYGCTVWCDVVHTTTAKTLATFGEDYYAGFPCFTENQLGSGKAYYLATRPDEEFMRAFVGKILAGQGIRAPQLPEGVESVRRSKGDTAFDFYLNHGEAEKQVRLPKGKYEDMLTGAIHEGTLALAKYGVSILRRKEGG